MDIWYILWTFGTFYGHLVYVLVIWNICYNFGMLYQEKSGNPALDVDRNLRFHSYTALNELYFSNKLGSMLRSQFSATFSKFRPKTGIFHESRCYAHFCA
jgi:hypothetical protein